MVLAVVVLLDNVACVKNIAMTMGCQKNLKNTHQQLYAFSESNDEFPKTEFGHLDLAKILESQGESNVESCLCLANKEMDCYLFRSGLVPKDLWPSGTFSDAGNTIIAVERNLNHAEMNGNFRTTGRFHIVVLLANGRTKMFTVTPEQHVGLLRRLERAEMIHIDNVFEE